MPLVKRSTKGSPLSIAEMDANWDYATLGGYTYTEVAVSSAELVTIDSGANQKELLPAPGAGKYYDLGQIIVEYTYDTAAYTTVGVGYCAISDSGGYIARLFNEGFLTEASNSVILLDGNTNIWGIEPTTIEQGYNLVDNSSIEFFIDGANVVNPGTAAGTLLFKIWYKVKTFGTEL